MGLTQSQKTPYEKRIALWLIYPLLTPTLSNVGLYGIISNTLDSTNITYNGTHITFNGTN